MAGTIVTIKLKWLDESAFLEEGSEERVKLFLESIGISSDVASDLLQVMLLARAKELSLKTGQIRKGILELRKRRGDKDSEKGLTDRNIQVWLKYYETIGLFERYRGKHRFRSAKSPHDAFKRCKQMTSESLKVSERLLELVQESYGIK